MCKVLSSVVKNLAHSLDHHACGGLVCLHLEPGHCTSIAVNICSFLTLNKLSVMVWYILCGHALTCTNKLSGI